MEEPGIFELLVRLGAQTIGNHRLDDDFSFNFQRVYPEIVSADVEVQLIFTNNNGKNIKLSSTAKSILDSWVVGEDYTNFQYEYH